MTTDQTREQIIKEAEDLLLAYDEPSLEDGAIGSLYRVTEALKAAGNAAPVVPITRHKRHGGSDKQHAAWLADKIHAFGDYAQEAAAMLNAWPDEQAVREKALEEAAKICENKVIDAISKSYAEDERDRAYQECADDLRALISKPESDKV